MGYDYIKSKLAFNYSETYTALAANREFHLKLPAQSSNAAQSGFFGAWLFAEATVTNAGSVVLSLTEAIATAGDGTPITLVNLNRLDTPMASLVPAFHTPTTPTGGTVLQSAAGALSEPAQLCAWILKPATNYLIRVAPTGTPNGAVNFKLKQIPNFDFLYQKQL